MKLSEWTLVVFFIITNVSYFPYIIIESLQPPMHMRKM